MECGRGPLEKLFTTCVTVPKFGHYRTNHASESSLFMEKKKLFTGKVNLDLKKRIMKCLVWSVALYAAETCTLTQTDRRRLEAFEMWIWR